MTSVTSPDSGANLFGPAYDLLRTSSGGRDCTAECNGISEATRKAAIDLLLTLGYCQPTGRDPPHDIEPADHHGRDNCLSLLALAARLDRTFRLPMRHAPGACFIGAMVSPERLAIAGHPATGVGGRGLDIRQAFESCVGEAAEYLSFIARGDEATGGRENDGLARDELDWAVAGLGLESERRLADLDWLAARCLGEDRRVRFPAELVLRRPAGLRKAPREAESTGVGAGSTRDAATLSGLLEVIERDAIGLWWHGGAPARPAGTDLTDDPEFGRFMAGLRGDSDRVWRLLDITTDLGVPTFAALSAERDGRVVVAGFSTRLDAREAARGAILEMCQMELAQDLALAKLARQGEETLGRQDRLWIARARDLSLETTPQLQAENLPRTCIRFPPDGHPLAALVERLRDRSFHAYSVDLTRPDPGIPVVRVIVPGLQSAKPDWITPRLAAAAEANDQPLDRIGESTALI